MFSTETAANKMTT